MLPSLSRILLEHLHTNKETIILQVLAILQGFNVCELDIPITFVIPGGCRSLKCQKVRSGYQGFTDMTFVFAIITLVEDRQGYSTCEKHSGII
jgi:hypothetical protein